MFKRKEQEMMKSYYCKHCTRSVYVKAEEQFDVICSVCKRTMDYHGMHPYRPSTDHLKTWNQVTPSSENNTVNTTPIIECPYCNSTNTQKITVTAKAVNTAVFGIFGTKRFKQWHCNNCNSDF